MNLISIVLGGHLELLMGIPTPVTHPGSFGEEIQSPSDQSVGVSQNWDRLW